VPFALAAFPKELTTPPRRLLERVFRVERYTPMPHGGHFAALEQPKLLAADIAAFFRPLR
jgi:pimeloyl-ACP methyl ester carboxylesterase